MFCENCGGLLRVWDEKCTQCGGKISKEDEHKIDNNELKLEESLKEEDANEEDIDEEYNMKFYERESYKEANNSNIRYNLREVEGPIKFHSNGITSDFEFENSNEIYRVLDENEEELQQYYDEVLESEDGLMSVDDLLKAKVLAKKRNEAIKDNKYNSYTDLDEKDFKYKEGRIFELENVESAKEVKVKVDEKLYEPRGLEVRNFINKRWFYVLGTTSIIFAMVFNGLLFSFIFMLALNGGKALVDDGKVLSGTLIIIITYTIFIIVVLPVFVLYLKIVLFT